MKLSASLLVLVWLAGLAFCPMAEAQLAVGNIRPAQRANSKLVDIDYDITGTNVPVSVSLQGSADGGATWTLPVTTLTGAMGTSVTPGNNLRITWNAGVDWNQLVSTRTKFRITVSVPDPFAGFELIPAAAFVMGDLGSEFADASVHVVNVSSFYLAKNLTTKAEWDMVRTLALINGYTDIATGTGKGTNHPVVMVSWFDVVKWCNARSEQEGLTPCYEVGGAVMRTGTTEPTVNWGANGYRLPTEAEWEKAARGGLSVKRFPWESVVITHSLANYFSSTGYSYDFSLTRGYHPTYAVGSQPYTSPVGSFSANGYGLNDMAGNVWQFCWDWYGVYGTGTSTDPRGAMSGSGRVARGGSWSHEAKYCRVSFRYNLEPTGVGNPFGFRSARSSVTLAIPESPEITVDTRDDVQLTVSALHGSVTGGGLYRPGSTVSLSAIPAPGYAFSSWSGGASGTANPLSIVLNADTTVTANFLIPVGSPVVSLDGQLATGDSVSKINFTTVTMTSTHVAGLIYYTLDGTAPGFDSTLYGGPVTLTNSAVIRALGLDVDTFGTVEAPPTTVTIIPVAYPVAAGSAGGGRASVSPLQASYLSNSIVIITATASNGWSFLNWAGDASGTSNPLSYPVNAPSTNVQAVFGTVAQANLIGHGTVQFDQANPVAYGTTVQATATPSNGCYFIQWGGAASGTENPVSFAVITTNPVVAIFTPPVSVATAGAGSVSISPAQMSYPSPSVLTITATASNGWNFLNWAGDASGTSNPLSLTVDAPKQVSAVFGTSVGTAVIGSGTVELYPANPAPYGAVVRATAVPSSGSYFVSWGGAITGTNNPSSFSVINTNVVRAIFTALPANSAALTVRLSGEGEVTAVPRKAYYTLGDTVTLTATARGDVNQFLGWSGDVTGTANETVLTMSSSKIITASFASGLPILHVTLTGALNARQVTLNFVGLPGQNYILESSTTLEPGQWISAVTNRAAANGAWTFTDTALNAVQKFYRVTLGPESAFALIPAGTFSMGDAMDGLSDAPVHAVNVSEFYMAKNLTTTTEWDAVRTWALSHGYPDLSVGEGKGTDHPVVTVSWFDAVKWCNARSELEALTPCYQVGGAVMKTGTTEPTVNWGANGYRLPTEAEWEKAARGGLIGKRFPWGDTITHSQANFARSNNYSYDLEAGEGYPFANGAMPYTSPVGSFAANAYGLNDMAGNVWQWCWDWYGAYGSGTPTDPRGAMSGSDRVFRGGSWSLYAASCRVANRGNYNPTRMVFDFSFRVARSSVP